MRALVTGTAGFLGLRLAKLLPDEDFVAHDYGPMTEASLESDSALEERAFDAV